TIHLVASLDVGQIRPQDGRTISGHIRDASGNPLQGVRLTAFPSDGWDQTVATSEADGSYQIRGLEAVDYRLLLTPGSLNYQTGWYAAGASGQFSVRRSDATSLTMSTDRSGIDFVLPAGYTIRGRITDTKGRAVPSTFSV